MAVVTTFRDMIKGRKKCGSRRLKGKETRKRRYIRERKNGEGSGTWLAGRIPAPLYCRVYPISRNMLFNM